MPLVPPRSACLPAGVPSHAASRAPLVRCTCCWGRSPPARWLGIRARAAARLRAAPRHQPVRFAAPECSHYGWLRCVYLLLLPSAPNERPCVCGRYLPAGRRRRRHRAAADGWRLLLSKPPVSVAGQRRAELRRTVALGQRHGQPAHQSAPARTCSSPWRGDAPRWVAGSCWRRRSCDVLAGAPRGPQGLEGCRWLQTQCWAPIVVFWPTSAPVRNWSHVACPACGGGRAVALCSFSQEIADPLLGLSPPFGVSLQGIKQCHPELIRGQGQECGAVGWRRSDKRAQANGRNLLASPGSRTQLQSKNGG